jgi:16S rRNA (cytidine1402-2'-O)-methyltransferase
VIAATPIGNVADMSPRLAAELATADIIAAEDTRRLGRLTRDVPRPTATVVSLFEANEARRVPELVAALVAGRRVMVVTDAGMPGVSDPGFRVISAAIEAGVRVTVIPGPSAVLAALVVSGLPSDRFCCEGFLPRKAGERSRRLADLGAEPRTMIFFEAPHRIARTLDAMVDAFGPERPAAVCRELTKVYEEVRRGPLSELAAWAALRVRGEITIVVGGAPAREVEPVDPKVIAEEIVRRVAAGESRRDAVAGVAATVGVARRLIYDALGRSGHPTA